MIYPFKVQFEKTFGNVCVWGGGEEKVSMFHHVLQNCFGGVHSFPSWSCKLLELRCPELLESFLKSSIYITTIHIIVNLATPPSNSSIRNKLSVKHWNCENLNDLFIDKNILAHEWFYDSYDYHSLTFSRFVFTIRKRKSICFSVF